MVLDTFVLNVPDVSGISLTAENVVSAADDGKASWQVGDAIVWVDGTEVRKGKAAVADSMKPDVATHTMVVQRMVPAKPGFVTFIARIAGDPGLGIGLTEDNRISELAEKRPGRNDGRLEVHCAARSRRSSSGRSQLRPELLLRPLLVLQPLRPLRLLRPLRPPLRPPLPPLRRPLRTAKRSI